MLLYHIQNQKMIGCWVVVKFSSSWHPGEIVTIQEEETKTKCMKRVGIEKQFVWPEIEDISWFETDSLLCLIEPPIPIGSRTFGVSLSDLNNIKEHLKRK